jgi:C-terminal processing protease CtpA/Prc
MKSRLIAAVLLSVFLTSSASASTDALVQLCRVWSEVKFLDPQLMTRETDWDTPLIHAIPAARAANTPAETAAAIAAMLAELSDPVTRVVRTQHADSKPKLIEWHDDVLMVNVGPYADSVSSDFELIAVGREIEPELAKAKAVVFDLRTRHAETPGWVLDRPAIVDQPVAVPASRYVFRSGYPLQSSTSPGSYYSAIQVVAPPAVAVAEKNAHVPSRIVFIVGDEVPERVAALWSSGKAAIVSTRPISSANVGETRTIGLDDRWEALIRITEPGMKGLTADAVAGDASAMEEAIALARGTSPLAARPAPRESPVSIVAERENAYPDMQAPDASYRILALFRLWSVIDRFYPYKKLIGDWDGVLREFIPRFESAEGADAYARTVMELAARIEDGHTSVFGPPAVWDVLGVRWLPVDVRPIEGRFIVTAKHKALPADADINIGDEIVNVDGESLADRVKRLWKYFAGSTETARRAYVLEHALRGGRDSVAELLLRGKDEKERTVKIARTKYSPMVNEGPVWRVIDGNIGFIDLTRLTPAQVDEALDAVKNTRALIFDMRGYPNGGPWLIAPRINTKNAKIGAVFSRPQLSVTDSDLIHSRFSFEQQIPASEKPKYTGRTVMLIDERTYSEAEHTGLFFEAANGTKFIGSNSAGENGDVTDTLLPGGIDVTFSGQEVRHADGRQLQRIGLVPDVPVTPTIQGIRAGRDEVLDRAVEYLGH